MLTSNIATSECNESSSPLPLPFGALGAVVLVTGVQSDQANIQAAIPWRKNKANPRDVAMQGYSPLA